MAKYAKWLGLGAGWVFGGPIGAIVGLAIGSLFDSVTVQKNVLEGSNASSGTGKSTKTDFAISLMVLIAAVMKADGKIMKSELNFVKDYLTKQFGFDAAQELTLVLRDIVQRDIPVDDVCFQIKRNLDYSSRLQLLHLLYGIAQADGKFEVAELDLIKRIASNLGISDADKEFVKSFYFTTNTNYAYDMLEISASATDEEVKKAYRKMAIKFHPDKVSHLGEEVQNSATEKFKKLNEAYEKIKKERGLN
ncbi:MAG: TerB family tellurite resistance protein [Bacteroidales bacterium]|nr:TerB family tellurite resistance protein [Bacteroidales bacterium]